MTILFAKVVMISFLHSSGSIDSMSQRKLRWLQLSDLHAGMAFQNWLWPSVASVFLEDLDAMVKQFGGIDLVIFSGDMVQKGLREEFDRLDAILTEVWDQLRATGSDPLLFVVPGNHDLCRPKASALETIALKHWNDDDDVRNDFFGDTPAALRNFLHDEVFKEYLAWRERPFVNNIRSPVIKPGLLPGDCSATVEKDDFKVGLAGLNSTWLQIGEGDYKQRLHVDFRQLLAITDGNPNKWTSEHAANLLISHQPISWLYPESLTDWYAEIDPPGRFDVHMFGHMHEATADAIAVGGSQARISIQAPSLFGLEKIGDKIKDRIHGYLLAELSIDEQGEKDLKIWPRLYKRALSGQAQMIANTDFVLDKDGACNLSVKKKAQLAKSISLAEIPSKMQISAQDIGNIRHSVYCPEPHGFVRKIEQEVCANSLSKDRLVWIASGWGLASDEFIASVQFRMFSKLTQTFQLDLSGYQRNMTLVEYIDQSVLKSFTSLCDAIAKRGQCFLILDGLADVNEKEFVQVVEEFGRIVRDFCPEAYLIFKSRAEPADASIQNVKLAPLDMADTRSYLEAHKRGGELFTPLNVVSLLHRHTDGVPAQIDSALRDVEIVGLNGLVSLNTDVRQLEANNKAKPMQDALATISSLEMDDEPHSKRVLALLRYLSLFPNGETFERIFRIEGAYPFHPSHARVLLNKALLDALPVDHFWNAAEEFPAQVLRVPRVVRDAIKIKMTREALVESNKRIAALYFGEEWSAGNIRLSRLRRFDNPNRTTAEIGNASTIIIRLITEEAESEESYLLHSAIRLASTFISQLNDGTHFRSAAAFFEEVVAALPEGFEIEKASLRAKFGRSLRMVGEHAKAKKQFSEVKDSQPTKSSKQLLLVGLALCHQSLGEIEDAIAASRAAIKLGKWNPIGLQAQGVLIQLTEVGQKRRKQLTELEAVCRKRKAFVTANNIAILLAREGDGESESVKELLQRVMVSARRDEDYYNEVRAVLEYCEMRMASSESLNGDEQSALIAAYHIAFHGRISALFDRAHDLLWNVFEQLDQRENLLVLFRQSSLIWRLRGDREIERGYLERLSEKISDELGWLKQRKPVEAVYYVTRVAEAEMPQAKAETGDDRPVGPA